MHAIHAGTNGTAERVAVSRTRPTNIPLYASGRGAMQHSRGLVIEAGGGHTVVCPDPRRDPVGRRLDADDTHLCVFPAFPLSSNQAHTTRQLCVPDSRALMVYCKISYLYWQQPAAQTEKGYTANQLCVTTAGIHFTANYRASGVTDTLFRE